MFGRFRTAKILKLWPTLPERETSQTKCARMRDADIVGGGATGTMSARVTIIVHGWFFVAAGTTLHGQGGKKTVHQR